MAVTHGMSRKTTTTATAKTSAHNGTARGHTGFPMRSSSSFPIRHRVAVVVFLDMLGVGVLIPMLPALAKSLGAGPATIGLLGSLYGALNLVGGPCMGHVSDRYGRRFALLLALLGSGLGYAGLGFATSIIAVILCRIPTGLLKQSMTVAKAYISQLTSHEERAAGIARLNLCSSAGFMFGPAIGGYISAASPQGHQWAALLTGTIFALDAAFVWFAIPQNLSVESSSSSSSSSTSTSSSLSSSSSSSSEQGRPSVQPEPFQGVIPMLTGLAKKVSGALSHKRLAPLVAVRALLGFGVMIFRNNLASLLEFNLNADPVTFGMVISWFSAVSAFSSLFVGHVVVRAGSEEPLLVPGMAVTFFAMATISTATSITVVAAALVPLAAASSVLRACQMSLITKACHPDELGSVIGSAEAVMSLGRLAAPAVGGLALGAHRLGPIAICTVLFTAAVTIALKYIVRGGVSSKSTSAGVAIGKKLD